MRDGCTRPVEADRVSERFLEHNQVSLTVLTGPQAGSDWVLDRRRILIGRSRSADVRIDDSSVSHEHAAVELASDGFAIRDLASTNGVQVKGATVEASDLKHGDRIEVGACELQYVVQPRNTGRTWQLDDA